MNLRKIIRAVECDGFMGWQINDSGWRRATCGEVADLGESHGLCGKRLDRALGKLLDRPVTVADIGETEYERVMRRYEMRGDMDAGWFLLFHEMLAYMAERRLQRWLAGRLLPANLSPAGLEAAYRRAGNKDRIPKSFWSAIKQIN